MAKEIQDTLVPVRDNQLVYRTEFENIYDIISFHKKRAMKAVHNESLLMLWEVGGYVSGRLKQSAWGDGVVRMLADYIRTRSPKAKGWSYRTLYKMVQFYDTYSTASFNSLVEHYGMQHYLEDSSQNNVSEIVPSEMAQINEDAIVQFEMAQILSVLLATGWTNHQIILNRCKSDEQRLFYILYAGCESLENKELVRMIQTDAMSSVLKARFIFTKRNAEE